MFKQNPDITLSPWNIHWWKCSGIPKFHGVWNNPGIELGGIISYIQQITKDILLTGNLERSHWKVWLIKFRSSLGEHFYRWLATHFGILHILCVFLHVGIQFGKNCKIVKMLKSLPKQSLGWNMCFKNIWNVSPPTQDGNFVFPTIYLPTKIDEAIDVR